MRTPNRTSNNLTDEDTMSLKRKLTFIAYGVGAFFSLIAFFLVFNWERVEGNERLLTQDFRTGLSEEIIASGTFFYIPLKTSVYKYNVGTEKFIMGKQELYNGKGSDRVDYPPFTVTTGGNGKEQPATFSVTLQYRINPTKLVELHKSAQQDYEDLVIKPALTRIISDLATTQTVLDFYSGEGRVNLQRNIEKAITDNEALSAVGIVVETFVIDSIDLDPAYVAEITGRQLASQKKLRAIEETKAAEEVAKRVEAEAEADKLKKIVEADASKQQRVKAAEAAAQETKLAAEASRYQKEQDAKGLLAQGTAEAEVAKKKAFAKYSGSPGARQAQVEIEQARVELFKNMNLHGIVPEKTVLTIINGGKDVAPVLNVNPAEDAAADKAAASDAHEE